MSDALLLTLLMSAAVVVGLLAAVRGWTARKAGRRGAWHVSLAVAGLAGVVVCWAAYEAAETDADSYRALRSAFKAGSPAFRAHLAEAMSSGTVSRWERAALMRQFRQENATAAIEARGTNVAEERLVLAALARQVKAP